MRDLTPERLTRLLAMITYFGDGRTVAFADAAEHFGITEKQLLDDINTLWVSGAPGYSHSELIDFEASAFDQGMVRLREAQKMDRPLRLSPGEAVALLVALNSLIARLGENETLLTTRQKLQHAAGEAATAAEAVHITRTPEDTQRIRQQVEAAIAEGKQLWIRYVSGMDQVSERTIDPVMLNSVGEHWVLGAWCHKAQGDRRFRLDRILDLDLRDEPVSQNATAVRLEPLDTTDFAHEVSLRLASQARWVTEQIPVESVTEHGDSFTVVIASSDPLWLSQLCLRLGDSIVDVSPPDVAGEVHRYANDALALYQE